MSIQPVELICEKAFATSYRPLGPSETLRRVLECISSGMFMPGKFPEAALLIIIVASLFI